MANIPNQVTLTVTNAEVAAELEALALAYEDTVQKLRYEADRLRQGFTLTLDVRATQVHMPAPAPTPEPSLGERMFAEKVQKVGLKPTTAPLPEDAIRLIDEMTKTDNKGEEE
ncbi:hypothetical protein SEA_HUWBERT_107 [Microbacterium phage Huwbert]|nr:hypothetical protein SEA_HUWBERT_107 [Microbacterium phage Huwbert]